MVHSPALPLRLLAVFATSVFILATLGVLAYAVSGAFGSMTYAANQMDDTRTLTAANGALSALKKQLGATVRDNAYWDDAYRNVSTTGGAEWSAEMWGSITGDYPLYDTAVLVDGDGKALMAYHKGTALDMKEANSFFRGNLADMIAAARTAGFGAANLAVAFVKTRDGIALAGAAAIQPSDEDPAFDIASAKVLIFSKQLTPKVVSEVAETFSIAGLQLTEGEGAQSMLHADILDINGREIGQVTWPPMHPGTASYNRVRPTVVSAAFVFAGLLLAVAVSGFLVFRGVRKGELAATHKAQHDSLTGLWNRAGCLERLDAMLATDDRRQCALHILDLDGFKPVNDAWGHAVGDQLITAVAERLLGGLPQAAVVARLGGDEFAVIGGSVLGTGPRPLANSILTALATPFMIDGRTIEIGGSVGWAEADVGTDSAELLRRADLALYRAKDLGRGMAVIYEPSLDEDAGKHAELEQELRHGLVAGTVRVVFQPLIDAASREVSGVEALARWTSPTRGPVSPSVFIAIAEKAGLIDKLGIHVLKTALREGSRWPGIGVSVNVSPLQLRNPYFCGQVAEALAQFSFEPSRLTIEVTESVFIANPEQAKRAFDGLRKLGVKVALDDFGCGYASIGTLREFGFDRMKIDRSLVLGIEKEENGSAVLQATVALANALHLPVTAEGIETEEQAAAVRLSGCDKLQGYLFSKPVTATEITARYFASSHAKVG